MTKKQLQKANKVIKMLNDYRMEERGHSVHDYVHSGEDNEISVWDMNVPSLADCKQIAMECGCAYKYESLFEMFIFYI